jgi:hypothetical protein
MPAFPPTPITLNCSRLMTNFPSCIGNRRENVACKMHMRRRHIAYPPYGHSHTRSHARRPRKWTCDGHQWQACLPKFSNSPPCMCVCVRAFYFLFFWVGEVEEDRVRVLKSSSLRARRSRSVQRHCQRTAELLSRRGRRTRALLRLREAANRGGR